MSRVLTEWTTELVELLIGMWSPKVSHLISSHLISSHLISSHLISSHLISSHLISSHLISSDQIRSDQIRSDQIRSDQIRPDQTRPDQIRSDQIRSDQIRSDQIRSDQDQITAVLFLDLCDLRCVTVLERQRCHSNAVCWLTVLCQGRGVERAKYQLLSGAFRGRTPAESRWCTLLSRVLHARDTLRGNMLPCWASLLFPARAPCVLFLHANHKLMPYHNADQSRSLFSLCGLAGSVGFRRLGLETHDRLLPRHCGKRKNTEV